VTLLLVLFFTIKHGSIPQSYRQYGFFFLTFLFCTWTSVDIGNTLPSKKKQRDVLAHHVLTILLFIHLLGSAVPVMGELAHDFSSARAMGDVLVRVDQPHTLYVAYPSYLAGGIIPYTEPVISSFYFLETQTNGTYGQWTATYFKNSNLTFAQILERMEAGKDAMESTRVVLLLNTPLSPEQLDQAHLQLIAAFPEAIVANEGLFAYASIE
jgi:hypothetical protein